MWDAHLADSPRVPSRDLRCLRLSSRAFVATTPNVLEPAVEGGTSPARLAAAPIQTMASPFVRRNQRPSTGRRRLPRHSPHESRKDEPTGTLSDRPRPPSWPGRNQHLDRRPAPAPRFPGHRSFHAARRLRIPLSSVISSRSPGRRGCRGTRGAGPARREQIPRSRRTADTPAASSPNAIPPPEKPRALGTQVHDRECRLARAWRASANVHSADGSLPGEHDRASRGPASVGIVTDKDPRDVGQSARISVLRQHGRADVSTGLHSRPRVLTSSEDADPTGRRSGC